MALARKAPGIWTIEPRTTVLDALNIMTDRHVGALVVLDDRRVVGIVSERDILRRGVLPGHNLAEIRVRDIMTANVLYVRPDQPLEEAMALMIDKGVRHLPVMDGAELASLLSIRDVVREVIPEQQFIIEQLEQYIRH